MLGFFGKMPSNGDFVSKGFSPAFIDGLDKMFQTMLITAASKADDSREMYERSSPFMLNIRPGALASSGFLGAVVPSCDRVGRLFPLCVGAEIAPSARKGPLLWPSSALSSALLKLTMNVLQLSAGPDALHEHLLALKHWDALAHHDVPFGVSEEGTIPQFDADASHFWYQGPEEQMTVAAHAECNRLAWVGVLLGETLVLNGEFKAVFAARNLQSFEPLAAIMDERWEHWGWRTNGVASTDHEIDCLLDGADQDATLPSSSSL